jgi:hypothetical protein
MDRKQAEALIRRERKMYCRDSDYVIARDAEHKYSAGAMGMLGAMILPVLNLEPAIDKSHFMLVAVQIGCLLVFLGLHVFSLRQSRKFREVRQQFEDHGPQNFSDLQEATGCGPTELLRGSERISR